MSAMMREALEFHLEGLASQGDPIPDAKTVVVEFKPEDFEDVDYFVVQTIEVNVPDTADSRNADANQAA
jgi:predicted RNase H-like HicB family nuclease